MKKIAFVYDAIYPYVKGGAEIRYYELGKRLTLKGYEVHFYGMKYWKGKNVIIKNNMYYHGLCDAKKLYIHNGRRSIWEAIFFGLNCLKLINQNFDILDCCGFPYFSLFSCKIICILKRKKLYSTWHEVWGKEYWKSYLNSLFVFGYMTEKLAVKMPDEIIAVSEFTAIKIKKELGFNKKVATIPNGIDLNYIKLIKSSKIKSDIIYAGRLMNYKNLDILIEALAIIKKDINNIKCIIIGDGPEKSNLEKLKIKLKLSENILFIKFLESRHEVYSLMKSSKIFVLPSTREGFGIVALEANALGLPVITTMSKNNATKYLIEVGKNGYLIKSNVNELATYLKKYLTTYEKKVDYIDVINKYSLDTITNNIEKVYLQ